MLVNAIYNEIEPFAADWLERLVEHEHIATGLVERRSIADLRPSDVAGPGQRHFFAGIGGWSYALRLAGVPDDASVWTGSCPCQPFSQAGAKKGFDDHRHLWPAWFALIRECRPPIVFGEQVASPDGLKWLDTVYADMEGAGYSVGAADLCAAGIGAPHIRQRLYFVAHASSVESNLQLSWWKKRRDISESPFRGAPGILANSNSHGRDGRSSAARWQAWGDATRDHQGLEWISCADERRRPIKPGVKPLAHGLPRGLVEGGCAGAGNAIVPQVAAEFIYAALEAIQ